MFQVCTSEEEEILSRGSKKSEKLRQYLMKDGPTALLGGSMFNGDRDYLPNDRAKMKEGYLKAEKHKEKLLEFDRTRLGTIFYSINAQDLFFAAT